MESRTLIWSKRAIEKFNRQMFLYSVHDMGAAATTFRDNIQETVSLIFMTPNIGRLENAIGNKPPVYR